MFVGKKILLVDDEENVCRFMSRFLEMSGYECDYVTNGQEAIDSFTPDKYFMAIVDLRMPGVDGIAVIKHIKDVSAETICIMITGFSDLQSALRAYEHGCDDFLIKPLDSLHILIDTIKKCISRFESQVLNKCVVGKSLHVIEDIAALFTHEFLEIHKGMSSTIKRIEAETEISPNECDIFQEQLDTFKGLSTEIVGAFEAINSVLKKKECDFRRLIDDEK
jgi:YesN/AraC family two-component response regulator